ncbi:MAG: cytochrome c [Myxococcota bacterium]
MRTGRICGALVWVALAAGCAEDPRVAGIVALEGDAANGEVLYGQECTTCHGADASGGSGPAIDHEHSAEQAAQAILKGPFSMPSFADQFDDAEIADLIAHLRELGAVAP